MDILVVADVLPSNLLSGTRPNICGSLLGQETIFGWSLTGPVPAPRQNQYLDLNHMREVSSTHDSASHYLPHHAVLKPESTTTELRVVLNASSPSENGVSFNDILHAGRFLQSDLPIQILKWRYFRYVYSADIEKMYRPIWVDSFTITCM